MTYEEHIVGLKGIKPFLQEQMRLINYEGLGEFDAKEIGETIEAAISAVEKQIPKEPKDCLLSPLFPDSHWWRCPVCDADLEIGDGYVEVEVKYCPDCGQAID